MMIRKILAALSFFCLAQFASAAPFVASAVATGGTVPTGADCSLDSAAYAAAGFDGSASGPRLHMDVSGVSVGAHTITCKFNVVDPVWGTLEGPASAPFPFTRPSAPTATPSSLSVQIN